MNLRHTIVVVLFFTPGLALAQGSDTELTNGKFDFRIGGQVFSSFTSRVRVDSLFLGPGTEFEFENATDLEEKITIGRVDGSVRFNDRHSMVFSYYDIKRLGGKSLQTQIDWEGDIYPIGVDIESRFRQEVVKLAYAFSFMHRPKAEMGFTFGLHTMTFDLGLRARDGSLASSVNATAPLPVLGLNGQYRIGPKWRLVGSAEWLDVKVGDYQGVFTDVILSIEHDTFEHIGFGFGVDNFGLNVEATSADLAGLIDLGFDSAIIYMKGRFGRP